MTTTTTTKIKTNIEEFFTELMPGIFTQAIELVLAENQRVLQAIAYPAVEQLAQKIMDVEFQSHPELYSRKTVRSLHGSV